MYRSYSTVTDIDSNMFLPYTDEGRDGEDDGGEGERHHEGDAVDHVAREVLRQGTGHYTVR